MEKEEIIERLKISRDEFDRRMEELQEHFGNLLTEEVAVLLAAYSFGYEPVYSIEELADKKGKVVVEGVVEKIFGFREFVNKNGTGFLAVAILKDESARIKTVFWNEAAQLIKAGDIAEGDLVRVKGFVKRRENEIELSVGDASDIEVLDRGGETIKGVLVGKAARHPSGRTLVKAVIANGSGLVVCVAWDEKAEELYGIDVGKALELRGITKNGEFVISQIKVVEEDLPLKIEFVPISKIIPLQHVNLKGRISGLGEFRRVKSRRGESNVAEIFLSDETGRVKILLWDDNSQIYKKADIGDYVEIFNAYPKIGWDGEIEVHCGWNTIITLKKAY